MIFVFMYRIDPTTRKTIRMIMKIAVLVLDPNPTAAVNSESMMNAQVTAPALRMPVT
jgi:hypothetical protein